MAATRGDGPFLLRLPVGEPDAGAACPCGRDNPFKGPTHVHPDRLRGDVETIAVPMPPPPQTLDNADVLYWLASEDDEPFYFIPEGDERHPVMAMTICRYAGTGAVYLFKCDGEYRVWQDWDCESAEEAMAAVARSHGIPPSRWRRWEG